MNMMMARRRAIIAAQEATPVDTWDSVWDYSEGLPTVDSWERTTSGNTCSLGSTGLNIRKNSFEKTVVITEGIIEAKFTINNERDTMAETRAWLRIGDSSNAIYVIFTTYNSSHHIRLYNSSSRQNGTDLGTFTLGSEYIVQLTINGSVGSVSINGTVVKSDVDTAGMVNKGTLKFGSDGQYGGSTWQYVKYKNTASHGTWADLYHSISLGTYNTDYSVGEILPLDLGTEGVVNAQIVAFNADDKADDSGKAKVSFISQYCLNTSKRYNPSYVANTSGTGTLGGWEASELRAYLTSTIYPLVPANVKNRIVTVKKYTLGYTATEVKDTGMLTQDNLWVPSAKELNLYSGESGIVYSSIFTSNDSRKKKKSGGSYTDTKLRSANASNKTGAYGLTGAGTLAALAVSTAHQFPIGFCID